MGRLWVVILKLLLLMSNSVSGFDLLVRRTNDGETFCVSNESAVVAPIFELDASCADAFPASKNTEQKSWVDGWKVEGFTKSWTKQKLNFVDDWSSRQQMILDDRNFQNLSTIRIGAKSSGWTWISFSLLAKSVSFLVQQENSAGFLVVLDAPKTNFSKVEIRKCSGLKTDDKNNCKIVLSEEVNLLHGGKRWAHISIGMQIINEQFNLSIRGINSTSSKWSRIINFTHNNTLGVKNAFVSIKSNTGAALLKFHKSTILTPIVGEKQTLSRKFTLGEKGYINLELEWGWKMVATSGGRVEIVDLEEINSSVNFFKLTKTQQFSNNNVELDAGNYQITLTNTQEGALMRALLKTNQETLAKSGPNRCMLGCQFMKKSQDNFEEHAVFYEKTNFIDQNFNETLKGFLIETCNCENECNALQVCSKLGCTASQNFESIWQNQCKEKSRLNGKKCTRHEKKCQNHDYYEEIHMPGMILAVFFIILLNCASLIWLHLNFMQEMQRRKNL